MERAKPLAQLVLSKTAGNPFFVNQFLRVLYEEQLLSFDAGQGLWGWDVGQIHGLGLTDNVG